MSLRDLINELEEIAEDLGDDAEVRVGVQPSWPLRHALHAVKAGGGVVWLVASESAPYGESPYASKRLWQEGDLDGNLCSEEGCDSEVEEEGDACEACCEEDL